MFDGIINLLIPEVPEMFTNFTFIIFMTEVFIRCFIFGYIMRLISNILTVFKTVRFFD